MSYQLVCGDPYAFCFRSERSAGKAFKDTRLAWLSIEPHPHVPGAKMARGPTKPRSPRLEQHPHIMMSNKPLAASAADGFQRKP